MGELCSSCKDTAQPIIYGLPSVARGRKSAAFLRPRKPMEPCTNSPGSEVFYQELSEEETRQAYHGKAAKVHLKVVRTLEIIPDSRQELQGVKA